MLYPARMYRVTLGIDNTRRGRGIEKLHEMGVLHVVPLREASPRVREELAPGERDLLADRCAEYRARIERVLEAFQHVSPGTVNLVKDFFFPGETAGVTVSAGTLGELFEEIDSALGTAGRAITLWSEISAISERLGELEVQRKALRYLDLVPFDLSALGQSRFLSVHVALVEKETAGEIARRLAENLGDGVYIDRAETADTAVLVVACHAADGEVARKILRSPGVTLPKVPVIPGLPADVLGAVEREIGELGERKRALEAELLSLREEYARYLLALHEDLLIRREELDLVARCGTTREVTIIQGFVPERALGDVREGLETATGGHHFVRAEEPDPGDPSVPVRYENPPFIAPFEYITTMFSRPRYDEVDPTPFIAPIFLVFFGLMLGDAGYGIVIALAGYLVFRGAGRVSPTMRDLGYILCLSGISAIAFGAVQGGWFGDVPQRFLGITPPLVLIEPLKNPIAFFQLSLLLGIAHINLGLAIALSQNLKRHSYREAIFEQGIWFLLQPSAGVLLTEFFGWAPVPRWLHFLSLAGAAIAIALVFYSHGAMGFFSLTGFLGDWLSYVRILALALATGGIAMTVNILAQIVSSPGPLFIIPAIVVFLGGQAFNLVIQTLGGVIHAIRLQYIEFFGKFYRGGGTPFVPFSVQRVYSRRGERQ